MTLPDPTTRRKSPRRLEGGRPTTANPEPPTNSTATASHKRRHPARTAVAIVASTLTLAAITVVVITVVAAGPAWAAGPTVAPNLSGVIDALRVWLIGILAGLATLFLTIGGIRYLTAGGDPAEVERAKTALKSAAIGYALAALAPVVVSILQSVVGG
jgi:hypothetical protein